MTHDITRIAILTPAGVGAIAVLALTGPDAWSICRALFRTTGGRELPAEPGTHRVWTGRFGAPPGDEVVLSVVAVEPQPTVEVHCHGGRQVVRWLVEQCRELRAVDATPEIGGRRELTRLQREAFALLPHALTERTAGILLDQANGALDAAWTDAARRAEALQFAAVGRHLTRPWRVVVLGPPNVGKSSLINALAGYERSVVAATAGTTRDAASVSLAFDGWPIELIDTAGLRTTDDALEAAGIGASRHAAAGADLILWLNAADEPFVAQPADVGPLVAVINKCDLGVPTAKCGICVSVHDGTALPELLRAVVEHLVPLAPPPGAAVPFTEAIAAELERPRHDYR